MTDDLDDLYTDLTAGPSASPPGPSRKGALRGLRAIQARGRANGGKGVLGHRSKRADAGLKRFDRDDER